jgi:nucleotidyltransferase/DNA polymerase involved in DNA repair
VQVRAAIADTVGAAFALAVWGRREDTKGSIGVPPVRKRRQETERWRDEGEHRRPAGATERSRDREIERSREEAAIAGQSRIQNPESKIAEAPRSEREAQASAAPRIARLRDDAEGVSTSSPNVVIAPKGHAAAWLAPLPPAALRIDGRVADRLDALGVRSIGDLLMLPRSTLPARFGRSLVLRLQQALGEVHEGVAAHRPEAPPTAHVALEEPLRDGPLLQQLAADLLGRLLDEVLRRDAGLRRLECVVERQGGSHEATKSRSHEGAVQSSALRAGGEATERWSDGGEHRPPAGAKERSRDQEIGRSREEAARAGQSKIQNPKSKIDPSARIAGIADPPPSPFSISRSLDLSISFSIGLSRASRSRRHIGELLARRIEKVDCSAGVLGLRLTAREISPWTPGRIDLFDARPPGDAEALGCLIDRIANRVGYQAVLRPRLVEDHQPEMAFRYLSVGEVGLEEESHEATKPRRHEGGKRDGETERWRDEVAVQSSALPGGDTGGVQSSVLRGGIGTEGRSGEGEHRRPAGAIDRSGDREIERSREDADTACVEGEDAAAAAESKIQNPESRISETHPDRPLRLLPRPAAVRVMALVPEGPPVWMHYAGVEHRILHAVGPERIETAWWRGGDVRRDYYRVTSATGEQFWIFRELNDRAWRLHGVFT